MISDAIRSAAWEASVTHKIDVNLLLAIITVESNGAQFKTRYEPKWQYWRDTAKWSGLRMITEDTERIHQATSWGVCQIMGGVLRELGFDRDLPEACDIKINTFYGAKKLSILRNKYAGILDGISAYNAGIPVRDESGRYKNQTYVDRVSAVLKELRGKP